MPVILLLCSLRQEPVTNYWSTLSHRTSTCASLISQKGSHSFMKIKAHFQHCPGNSIHTKDNLQLPAAGGGIVGCTRTVKGFVNKTGSLFKEILQQFFLGSKTTAVFLRGKNFYVIPFFPPEEHNDSFSKINSDLVNAEIVPESTLTIVSMYIYNSVWL